MGYRWADPIDAAQFWDPLSAVDAPNLIVYMHHVVLCAFARRNGSIFSELDEYVEIAKLLIRLNTGLLVKPGLTRCHQPLSMAIMTDNYDLVRLLCSRGAHADPWQPNPLFFARTPEMVDVLAQLGCRMRVAGAGDHVFLQKYIAIVVGTSSPVVIRHLLRHDRIGSSSYGRCLRDALTWCCKTPDDVMVWQHDRRCYRFVKTLLFLCGRLYASKEDRALLSQLAAATGLPRVLQELDSYVPTN